MMHVSLNCSCALFDTFALLLAQHNPYTDRNKFPVGSDSCGRQHRFYSGMFSYEQFKNKSLLAEGGVVIRGRLFKVDGREFHETHAAELKERCQRGREFQAALFDETVFDLRT